MNDKIAKNPFRKKTNEDSEDDVTPSDVLQLDDNIAATNERARNLSHARSSLDNTRNPAAEIRESEQARALAEQISAGDAYEDPDEEPKNMGSHFDWDGDWNGDRTSKQGADTRKIFAFRHSDTKYMSENQIGTTNG